MKWKSVLTRGLLVVLGVTFIGYGIYCFGYGVKAYAQQLDQRDWTRVTAEVIAVKARMGGPDNDTKLYDIAYEYTVDGDVFSGIADGELHSKEPGDSIEIKYNPDSPKDSTGLLEPEISVVIMNFLGMVVFCLMGTLPLRRVSPKKEKDKKEKIS